jgi:hypothetical protein
MTEQSNLWSTTWDRANILRPGPASSNQKLLQDFLTSRKDSSFLVKCVQAGSLDFYGLWKLKLMIGITSILIKMHKPIKFIWLTLHPMSFSIAPVPGSKVQTITYMALAGYVYGFIILPLGVKCELLESSFSSQYHQHAWHMRQR